MKEYPHEAKTEHRDIDEVIIEHLASQVPYTFEVPDDEWKTARDFFTKYPTFLKYKKRGIDKHSFVKINESIYAIQTSQDIAKDKPDNRSVFPKKGPGLDCIGEGGAAKVKLAKKQNDEEYVALKIAGVDLKENEGTKRQTLLSKHEKAVLKRLNIPNLIGEKYQLKNSPYNFFHRFNKKQYQVLPLVRGPELFDIIRKINQINLLRPDPRLPSFALALVIESLKEVAFLHNRGILHRDIKLENFMLNHENKVKAVDFSTAVLLNPGSTQTPAMSEFVGTQGYIDADVLLEHQKNEAACYSKETDVYAYSEILRVLTAAHILPLSPAIQRLMQRLKAPQQSRIKTEELFDALCDVLESMPDLCTRAQTLIHEHEALQPSLRVLKQWRAHCASLSTNIHLGLENGELVSFNLLDEEVASIKNWLTQLGLNPSDIKETSQDPQKNRYGVVLDKPLIERLDGKFIKDENVVEAQLNTLVNNDNICASSIMLKRHTF